MKLEIRVACDMDGGETQCGKSKASGHPDPKSIGRDLSYGAFWRRAEHSRGAVRVACGTDSAQTKFKVLRMRPGAEVNFDYFLMALTIKSRTTAPTVAITNWPIKP
jgi:hypothetical protein